MKYFLLIILIFSLSCRESKPKTDYEKYLTMREAAANSRERYDTTIAGLSFNITTEQFKQNMEKLVQDSAVLYDPVEKLYYYEITAKDSTKERTRILAKFFQDTLYSLVFANEKIVKKDKDPDRYPAPQHTLMATLLKGKLGPYSITYQKTPGSLRTYCWFIKSLEIKISENDRTIKTSCTDLVKQKQKEAAEGKDEIDE